MVWHRAGGQDVAPEPDAVIPTTMPRPRRGPDDQHLLIASILRRVTTLFSLSSPATRTRPAFAQSSQSASANGLAGVWFVQVTLRNCDDQRAHGHLQLAR